MKELIEKLFELAKKNNEKNIFLNSQSSRQYFDYLPGEIEEVMEQFKENNTVYLEDELGDVLWVYINLLLKLEKEGLIESKENIAKRALKKFGERIADVSQKSIEERQDYWKNVKKKQKQELKEEHNNKYNK